ncbi:hypothetical protein IC744_03765 [Microbacterium hominis]|uniref:hypothetical protein n=1 Tax=Microbacterium TaxID=33882 RepID=UPI00168A4FCD|nr:MULTISPECIES: hypothetical protein [Microbacterium]QOC25501.1 hypothetical protein IC745_14420 [Microbacterium hominis]QOC29508.1 hypothetical protein IC744_03765 [Microbacterium hominis]QYF98149.1 hypothetical protein KY498_02520 [Microbacterium sp. PAMC21962]
MAARFTIGDDVFTAGPRGTIIEIREVGQTYLYGVESTTGHVEFYTERALKLAASS